MISSLVLLNSILSVKDFINCVDVINFDQYTILLFMKKVQKMKLFEINRECKIFY